MASTSLRPLPGVALPEPLRATDGLVKGAPPEDIFTFDTITKRMPKILDAVIESLPPSVAQEPLLSAIRELQAEMREGAQLKLLEPTSTWVGADPWNEHLALFISRDQGWHTAPHNHNLQCHVPRNGCPGGRSHRLVCARAHVRCRVPPH